MLNQQTPDYLSRSTGTQPTRRIQWQNPIQTHSGVSESQHQIPESFIPLDCSPESPVPTRELSGLHSPLYGVTQLGSVHPLKSVLLAQNLPPLPKFSGESSDGGFCKDIFQDWLEQFELIANVLGWSSQAKLVNLITRLQGQAYSFFRSCTIEQRTDYSLLVAELKKRFTPVTLPAIQTNLFHDRKQHVSESVDAYAQELRTLFNKAYPSVQQGTREAEALGQTILTNQFVVGLLPDIKAKIVGSEGNFNQLLLQARFEEVKLRELGVIQSSSPSVSVTQNTLNIPRSTFISPQQRSSGARPNVSPRCYNCGSTFHYIRQCPHLVKNKNTETPGKKGNESRDSNRVSNITLAKESPQSNCNEDGESRDDISSELDEIIATMHGISSDNVTGTVQLGPTLTAMIDRGGGGSN